MGVGPWVGQINGCESYIEKGVEALTEQLMLVQPLLYLK